MGGDIYRVGARQGATPPSTPSPRSRLWTGLLWPRDRHTYIRPVAAPLPATTQGALARTPPSEPRHPPRQPQGPGGALGASGAHAPRRLAPSPRPFSLIPPSPRRLPSVHLLLPTGECSGPTETGAPSPPSPFPYPTPGEDALVPAPHRSPRPRRDPPGSPRFPPGGRRAMPCHAGWTARRPRSMQRRPLPGYRQTATSLRHQETRRQPTTPPRSRSRHAMPCHPIHRIDRRGPLPCRLTDPHWPRIVRASVPRSQLDSQGAHKCTQGGPPPASQPSPPLPSLAVNWREQEPCHLGAQARPPPIPIRGPGWATPPPAKSSAPLQCCQLAKGRAH